jgi:hypothetical protein
MYIFMPCHIGILLLWLCRLCSCDGRSVLIGFNFGTVLLDLPVGWSAMWICLGEYPFSLKVQR